MHDGQLRLQTLLEYLIFIALALQQWLLERASTLRYKYIHCLLLCPWSNLLSSADSWKAVGSRDPGSVTPWSLSFFVLFILYFSFFTWPWAVESFPCPGDSHALWSSWVFRVVSGEVVMVARRRE